MTGVRDESTSASRFAAARVLRAARTRAARAAGGAVRVAGSAATTAATTLAQRAVALAPRIPIRDLATLQEQHDGLTGEQLADALVDSAARHSAAVGAGTGVAAVRLTSRKNPLTLPVQLILEPLAIAAVEIKLLAELHEVYDVPVLGTGAERARVFAQTWAGMRGLDIWTPGSAPAALGGVAKGQLSRTIAARIGGRLTRGGPYVAGATASGMVNGRSTREFGDAVRARLRDLRAERGEPVTSPAPVARDFDG